MSKRPLVSVIVPAYNVEKYLEKWGQKIDLKKYIRRGKILAFKPKN